VKKIETFDTFRDNSGNKDLASRNPLLTLVRPPPCHDPSAQKICQMERLENISFIKISRNEIVSSLDVDVSPIRTRRGKENNLHARQSPTTYRPYIRGVETWVFNCKQADGMEEGACPLVLARNTRGAYSAREPYLGLVINRATHCGGRRPSPLLSPLVPLSEILVSFLFT